jgi:hypothetical protein
MKKISPKWVPIKGASDYAISPQNYVYNLKTLKKMKRYWENLKDYSFVYDDEGKLRKVCHSNPTVETYGLPDEEMRIIYDYPDYKVTAYGAVWKYRKTGIAAIHFWSPRKILVRRSIFALRRKTVAPIGSAWRRS